MSAAKPRREAGRKAKCDEKRAAQSQEHNTSVAASIEHRRAPHMRTRFPTVWSSLWRVNVAAFVTFVSFSMEILQTFARDHPI